MPPLTANQGEFWHLCWRWDSVNRLLLALEDEIDPCWVSNLFCLEKPDGELRQIIDRRPRNSLEIPPAADAPKMGHASVFLSLSVPEKGCIRGSVDDLRNFYHEFAVSTDRALSTPVGPKWFLRDFWGSKALAQLKQRRPEASLSANTRVYSCFAGLSMGDHWAPCLAQLSHEELLRSTGALVDEEHLMLGSTVPRAPQGHYTGVCIDDKLSLQIFRHHVPAFRTDLLPNCRDLEACQQADLAYAREGLAYHPKKRKRRADVFSVWGAQFDGDTSLVGMDRAKLSQLSFHTALLVAKGVASENLLQRVLGLWAFGLQFRRPLFAVLQVAYNTGHPAGEPHSPFRMSRELQQELLLLAILGTPASTDLKVQPDPHVFATDASPDGAGIVSAKVGQAVTSELYRRADTRGFYTRLLSPPGAALQELGHSPSEPEDWPKKSFRYQDFVEEIACPAEDCRTLTRADAWSELDLDVEQRDLLRQLSVSAPASTSVAFRLDFIEIFTGSAKLSGAMRREGFIVGPPIEADRGFKLEADLLNLLLSLAQAGRLGLVWCRPPSTTFSPARSPSIRTGSVPWGLDVLELETAWGNLFCHQALLLFQAQLAVGHEAIIETPWGAYSRKLPWWHACKSAGTEVRVDMCRFGTSHRRSMALLCTSSLYLGLGRRCTCLSPHVRLTGRLTADVADQPELFCLEVVRIARSVAKFNEAQFGSLRREGQSCEEDAGTVEDHRGSQRFVSHLWSTHLAESLPWRTCRAYRFKHPNHINILESHAHKTLLQLAPMRSRLVVFQDSMVTLGANAKGRSSSVALNRIMRRKSLALQLGKDIYPVGIHCPTWAIRADDPSRRKRLRPSRLPVPFWLLALRRGSTSEAQDDLDQLSGRPRSWSRWLLFGQAAVLACGGGFTSFCDWSSTLTGSPQPPRLGTGQSHGPNSSPQSTTAGSFPNLDGGGESGQPTSPRTGSMGPHSAGDSARRVWQGALRAGSRKAQLCGNHQRDSSALSVCEKLPVGSVEPTYNVGKFVARESSSPHSTSAAQSSSDHGVSLALDQICDGPVVRLLRLTTSLRSHCLEGERLLAGCRDGVPGCNLKFLRLQLVKSRTRGARMQSVRIDVPYVVAFLKKCFKAMTPEEQIWPFSSAMLRRRLQQTLQAVTELPHLCVPSSLRAGGATYLFREWQEDVPRLQWRGRWLHFKTLAHYIQELGCWNIIEQLTPAARSRMQCLADLTESACKEIMVEADLPSTVQRLCMLLQQQMQQGIP